MGLAVYMCMVEMWGALSVVGEVGGVEGAGFKGVCGVRGHDIVLCECRKLSAFRQRYQTQERKMV